VSVHHRNQQVNAVYCGNHTKHRHIAWVETGS